jgi:hypothetical protein
MPALLMTAAEIAAAEALAAEILIAQQAAAATAAAAEAAQIAQAAQATQGTAQAAQAAQATTQAAQATQASTSGIQALAQEVGTTVQPTGIETLNVAQAPLQAQTPLQATTSAAEMEQYRQAASGTQNLIDTSTKIGDFASAGSPPIPSAPTAVEPFVQPPPQSAPTLYGSAQPPAPPGMGPNPLPDITAQAPLGSSQEQQLLRGNTGYGEFFDNQYNPLAPPTPPATGLQGLLDKGIAYAEKNPLLAGMGAMTAYNMLNQPEPYRKPKYKSTFNASTYRGYEPTPPTPYTPQYAQYAQGGWAEVAPAVMKELKKTGLLKDKSSFDPSKYVASNVAPPTPYTPQYAQGGISDLGAYSDYARGGRMLKGPGDGMSDDIPATIANKQPARLANEEFVVPADVVSHLGNGSSEAGAKALYKMMDRVRQARTGNKKQGKQISPEKFLA